MINDIKDIKQDIAELEKQLQQKKAEFQSQIEQYKQHPEMLVGKYFKICDDYCEIIGSNSEWIRVKEIRWGVCINDVLSTKITAESYRVKRILNVDDVTFLTKEEYINGVNEKLERHLSYFYSQIKDADTKNNYQNVLACNRRDIIGGKEDDYFKHYVKNDISSEEKKYFHKYYKYTFNDGSNAFFIFYIICYDNTCGNPLCGPKVGIWNKDDKQMIYEISEGYHTYSERIDNYIKDGTCIELTEEEAEGIISTAFENTKLKISKV